jgi:hypothetical protein
LEAFSILDPSKLSKESDKDLEEYRNRQFNVLSAYYGTGDNADVSREMLQSEWVALKPLLSQTCGHKNQMEFLVTNTLSTVSQSCCYCQNFASEHCSLRTLFFYNEKDKDNSTEQNGDRLM